MSNLRLISARIIDQVMNGRSLNECLESDVSVLTDGRDRAFVQAVCYGVCRFYPRLDVLLSELLQKPMKAKDSDVHALLMVGLYQLMAMRLPEYAAVTETVNAALKLRKPWAKGLINAILRQYLRERDALDERILDDDEARYAHPQWWIRAIKKDWPDAFDAILSANNEHPPMSLRVNQKIQTREEYIAKLEAIGCPAQPVSMCSSAIVLSSPQAVERLPGWLEGHVFVQDVAAQLAPSLLALAPKQRILDACSAPGGKLTHLLEMLPEQCDVLAVEKDRERLSSINANLKRLRLHAEVTCADVSDLSAWWDGRPFDRILLDAPCSASGVIRRHPDIKVLRQPSDIAALHRVQVQLLHALWQTLAPGGRLLYVTCSIFKDENEHVLQAFLKAHQDAREEKIDAAWGQPMAVGRQILPGQDQMDGFYYACLVKG